MTDVNFHIRSMFYYPESGSDHTGNFNYWREKNSTSGDKVYETEYYYGNDELYMFYPEATGLLNVGPSDTPDMYYFRLINSSSFSNTYPHNFNFGDLGIQSVGRMSICYSNDSNSFYTYELRLTDSDWGEKGWSINNFSTFKDEVLNVLARSIVNSRTKTGSEIMPMSQYDDWYVHYYMNQIASNDKTHFVIFYPGSDSRAEETITKTV